MQLAEFRSQLQIARAVFVRVGFVVQVSRLIMQLSALQQICVLRCFAYRPEHSIAILEAKHPQVHFVNSSAGSLWESITV